LIRAGKIKIKDKEVPVEIFLGGDYKVKIYLYDVRHSV
jgi:hypothetical protein